MDAEGYRKGSLRLFLELRDRKYLGIVDELFRIYEFEDIAKGIYYKYKILPIGWRTELEDMKSKKGQVMNWYKKRGMPFLKETTDNFPPLDKRRLLFPERGERKLDRIVDEFIEIELNYYEKLQVFISSYVSEVEAIAKDRVGPVARQALGLDETQVDFIFGNDLVAVCKAAESFLVVLETLSIVDATPNVEGGRAGHLADLIIKSGDSLLKAYAPYVGKYNILKKVLESKIKSLPPTTNTSPLRHLTFLELWMEISQSKAKLKQLSIDAVLITPIRRFPNYKVFFERIIKEMKEEKSDGLAKAKEAYKQIKTLTKKIDKEVSRQSANEDRIYNQIVRSNK